ncbi:hypothetical protein C1878_10805 [Gordonibacter sp. 28C]|nr:hypothetical protein C1878_10805 [Gordonibacter sp. 28C]
MFQLNQEVASLKSVGALLRVGGMDQYCCEFILPVVKSFASRHPEVTIEMHGVSNDDAYRLVQSHELDFSIAVGKQGVRDLTERIVGYEDLVLCVSRKLAKDSSDFERCLMRYPVLLDKRANYINYGFLQQGVAFPNMVHCDSDEAVKEGVLNYGFMGMIGTGRVQKEIEAGQVVVLHTFSSHVPVKAFAHKANQENPLHKAFFNLFRPYKATKENRPAAGNVPHRTLR